MGGLFEFKCPNCGYQAEVSGGEDCGFFARTETMVCKNCLQVVDVLVGFTTIQSLITMRLGRSIITHLLMPFHLTGAVPEPRDESVCQVSGNSEVCSPKSEIVAYDVGDSSSLEDVPLEGYNALSVKERVCRLAQTRHRPV